MENGVHHNAFLYIVYFRWNVAMEFLNNNSLIKIVTKMFYALIIGISLLFQFLPILIIYWNPIL